MLCRRHLFPQPPPRQKQVHRITLRKVDVRWQDTHINSPIAHSPLPNRRLVDRCLGREVQVGSLLRRVEDNRPVGTEDGMVVEYERDQLLRVFRIYYQGNIAPNLPVRKAVLRCIEEIFGFNDEVFMGSQKNQHQQPDSRKGNDEAMFEQLEFH